MKHLFINFFSVQLFILIKAFYLEIKERKKKLSIGYGSYISSCQFGEYNKIQNNVKLIDVSLGDFTYIANNSNIIKTTIGKFCSIGSNCQIVLGRHPSSTFISTHPAFFSISKKHLKTFVDKNKFVEYKSVEIGNDVWIGANVIILDGIKIGNGAIVATGSVVTKDVLPYSIVGGVPAKIIKYRFKESEITKLLKIKWWNWNIEKIKKNINLFENIKKITLEEND